MMKKYAYALAGLLLAGCTGDLVKLGANEQWGEFAATFTLQGKIMDARTGQPLGGDDLKLKLIQGTEIREPSRLVKDATDVLVGEYAFSNIPLTTQYQANYKLVAIKDGYIRFESVLDDFAAYYDTSFPLMDTVYNFIGNIYMQPTGAEAPDVTVNVFFNNKPVPNATVWLDPTYTYGNNGADQAGYTLSADYGYVGAVSGQTDTNGQIKFAGSTLGLGTVYQIRVNPVTFEGIQLTDSSDGSWWSGYPEIAVGVVGYPVQQAVFMSPATTGGNPYGLYVTTASNQWGALDPNGVLKLTFSRPVALTGDLSTKFGVYAVGSGVLVGAGPTYYASPALSTDGLTLTLTPNWTTAPNPAEHGAYVMYSNATVSVKDYPGTSYNIFGLLLTTGDYVDEQVWTTPRN